MSEVDLEKVRERILNARGLIIPLNIPEVAIQVFEIARQLAEEVERLRKDNEEWKEDVDTQTDNFVNACERVDQLREALEWYKVATPFAFERDNGEIARAALEEANEQL